jgi:membrane-bound serine protease (ClpP class)
MPILLDPNVAYLLLASGMIVVILALLSPGTGLLEILALLSLALAGYSMANLPVNGWALVVLLLGVFPFLLALRKSGRVVYLGVMILALIVGSLFLFRGETWYQPAVNPLLAVIVSIFSGGFLWLAANKILEAERRQPSHDLQALVGALGEAKTNLHPKGSVQVGGELWSAYSRTPIAAGAQVRVIGREGFVLEVEAVNHSPESAPIEGIEL